MFRYSKWAIAAVAIGSLMAGSQAVANGGRYIAGGHPYHNGHLWIPPASAYSAVTYRPPQWYGAPAYYYPQSYLAPEGLYKGPVVYPAVSTPRSYFHGYSYGAGYGYQGYGTTYGGYGYGYNGHVSVHGVPFYYPQ